MMDACSFLPFKSVAVQMAPSIAIGFHHDHLALGTLCCTDLHKQGRCL